MALTSKWVLTFIVATFTMAGRVDGDGGGGSGGDDGGGDDGGGDGGDDRGGGEAKTEGVYDCSSALRADLIKQHGCMVRSTNHGVVCPISNQQFVSTKMFSYQEEVPELSNATYVTLCVGLKELMLQYPLVNVYVEMFFNPNMIMAVLQTDRGCAYRLVKCRRAVLMMRKEMRLLPPMDRFPDDPTFWDFSSPLFGPVANWLLKFKMVGWWGEASPVAAVRALAGTGVREIYIRGVERKLTSEEKMADTDMTTNYLPSGGPRPRDLPIFYNMSALKILSLSLNVVLSGVCFINTPNIQLLSLNRIEMKTFPQCVRTLKHLIKLSVSKNNLPNLSTVFAEKLDIIEIDLSDNPLGIVPTDLPVSPKVLGLFLDSCGLQRLPPYSFRGLINLQSLSLRKNFIHHFDMFAFTALPKLRHLWLSSNGLRKWPIDSLKGLNLFQLHLSNNYLKDLPKIPGTTIQYLKLISNIIEDWDDASLFECQTHSKVLNTETKENHHSNESFDNCLNGTWVKELSLKNNKISTLTEPMMKSLGSVWKVDLRDNGINCADCNTPKIQKWLQTTNVQIREPFACSEPEGDRNILVAEVAYDPTVCLGPFHKMMSIVVPVCVVTVITFITVFALYVYRTEVAYLRHLIHIRHTSRQDPKCKEECIYDAFICYSGQDRKFVLRVLSPLLEQGPGNFRLCLFDRDFRLGTHIVSNIVEAIDHSTKVIVVLSQHFIASKWCGWELEMANHKLFGEDPSFLVLLELEPLQRDSLPRLLRFLLDTRPLVRWPQAGVDAGAEKAAVEQLRKVLGPSLASRTSCAPEASQVRSGDPPPDEHTPLLS